MSDITKRLLALYKIRNKSQPEWEVLKEAADRITAITDFANQQGRFLLPYDTDQQRGFTLGYNKCLRELRELLGDEDE